MSIELLMTASAVFSVHFMNEQNADEQRTWRRIPAIGNCRKQQLSLNTID